MTEFFSLVGMIIWIPAMIVYYGWVISVLWGWFMVPLFGLPAMGVGYAIGISCLVRMLRPVPASNDETTWKGMVLSIGLPATNLGLGWVVKTWFI